MYVYFEWVISLNGLLIPAKLCYDVGNHYISYSIVVIGERVDNTKYSEFESMNVQRDMSAYGVSK